MISDGHKLGDLPLGTECVRWVLKPDVDRTQFARALAQLGVAPAPVLTGESFPGWTETWSAGDYALQLQFYEAEYGGFVRQGGGWFEVGNEPDGQPQTASWMMPPPVWIELASACRAEFAPATTLVLGGQVSGSTEWIEQVKALLPPATGLAGLVDGLGVHPYARAVNKPVVRLAGYERYVVLEIDRDLYPLQIDTSFFAP
jgi:hypothetical protein